MRTYKNRLLLCAVYALIVFLLPRQIYAIETIVIDRGNRALVPMAVNNFSAETKNAKVLADEIVSVITNDLKRSGVFRPVSQSAFIEKLVGIKHKPLFTAWRQINSTLLLNGEVQEVSSGKLKISFILWDTVLEKDILGEMFETPKNLSRRVAHKISDKIYEKITGNQGYFDTKVVYVSETGPHLKRTKQIAIMDQDGANHKYLTTGKNIVLTPRFSPNADKILYLSYVEEKHNKGWGKKNSPQKMRIYMRDLKTGKEKLLGDFPGMSFAPHFAPDGKTALLSIAQNGSTHIYEVDLNTAKTFKLTSGSSINTSANYSPDGKRIVFNSDRSGSRQLYIMDRNGSNVERISFGGGFYAAPSWSPRGDYIAFIKISRAEGFTVGIMRSESNMNGNGERILTSGYILDNPCWAPNGRIIMFTRSEPPTRKGIDRSRLYSIDITGYNEQEVPTPKEASDPDWSNIL